MLRAPIYLQEQLDRLFPGVRLEWHPRLQWWVLTDYARWADGMPAKDIGLGVPNLMRGISPWEAHTNRGPLHFWGRIELDRRDALTMFGILHSLARARRAPTPEAVNKSVDELEAREAQAEEQQKRAQHAESRDRGMEAWHAVRRSMFGSGIRRTPWSHGRALDEEYKRRMREQTDGQEADTDAEVAQRLREGVGISSVKRSPSSVVT